MNKYRKIGAILWIILFANLFVALVKMVGGYIIKSTSLQADGLHSLTDSLSNVIGIIGIKIASKPADKCHPYGHKKAETIAALFIGFVLVVLSINIISGAVRWFFNPVTPRISLPSLIAIVLTILINISVSSYEYIMGKKLNSEILISDAKHTRSDIIISISVLFTLLSINLGAPIIIDPIVSIVVAILIIYTAYDILTSTSNVLMDKNIISSEEIKDFIIINYPQVKDVHKIRSRGFVDQIFIDLHIVLSGKMIVKDSHDLIHNIEERMKKEFKQNIDLIAHLEPY